MGARGRCAVQHDPEARRLYTPRLQGGVAMTDLGVADPGRPLSRIPQLLNPWLTLAGGTVGVLGLLWAAVQYLNPLRPVDVTVVSQDAVEFRLPAGAGALQKLALTYDGRAVDKVAIVPVTIINSG